MDRQALADCPSCRATFKYDFDDVRLAVECPECGHEFYNQNSLARIADTLFGEHRGEELLVIITGYVMGLCEKVALGVCPGAIVCHGNGEKSRVHWRRVVRKVTTAYGLSYFPKETEILIFPIDNIGYAMRISRMDSSDKHSMIERGRFCGIPEDKMKTEHWQYTTPIEEDDDSEE